MTHPFVVERTTMLGRRYAAQPDAHAELEAIWRALRHVPREHLASIPDVINYLHRQAGRLPPVMARLEVVAPVPVQAPRTRLGVRPAADHAAIVEGVFGKRMRPREQRREIVAAKGRRVRVVERGRHAGQMELGL